MVKPTLEEVKAARRVKAASFVADVTDKASVSALFDGAEARFGKIDISGAERGRDHDRSR